MKTIKNIRRLKFRYLFLGTSLLLSSIINLSCSDKESCEYDKPCTSNSPNSELAGFTVATCHSSNPTKPGGVIYDTSNNSLAPIGDDWKTTTSAPQVAAVYPSNWNSGTLGQIFGIAIDDNENIYLASSGIYNQLGYSYDNGTNSAKIYKCSAPGWNANLFASLPSSTGNLNDIGNIAYDKVNNQLFATNLEDGKIYRITGLNTGSGTIAETYDPWVASSGSGLEVQSEQIWGVGVNYEAGNVKVYFPRIAPSLSERSIYSITLNSDGSFPGSSTEIVEASNVPGTQLVISDIAFSSNFNEMLLSERGNPHESKVMSYSLNSGIWALNINHYYVGKNSGENSAGGVDFAAKEINGNVSAGCNEFFWASGNFMDAINFTGLIYGMQGISYAGNNAATPLTGSSNQETDIFIDYDPNSNAKGGIGDVEVFDASECFNFCNQ